MSAPQCPNGHGPMARRVDPSPMAAEQGEWWDCTPAPVGECCRSAVLVPWCSECPATPCEHSARSRV